MVALFRFIFQQKQILLVLVPGVSPNSFVNLKPTDLDWAEFQSHFLLQTCQTCFILLNTWSYEKTRQTTLFIFLFTRNIVQAYANILLFVLQEPNAQNYSVLRG